MNYRALYERFAGDGRTSPITTSAPITGRLTLRRRRRRSGSTAALVWAYAFNHEEAIRCFERALELDPDLAFARWGVAYAIGPNYNKAWEAFDPVDLAASLARARMELGWPPTAAPSAVERGLIEALQARFPTADPDDTDALHAGHASLRRRDVGLAEAYPDDIDVQALAADALVNVTAWALWDTRTGEPAPGSRVRRGQTDPRRRAGHPGGPRASRRSCTSTCTPWRCRRRRRRPCPPPTCCAAWCPTQATCSTCPATSTCCAATIATRWWRIWLRCRRIGCSSRRAGPLNFYSLYRAHNLHFIVYSAMFEGSSAIALARRRRIRPDS